MSTPQDIINLFKLKPLPGEGGYFSETYRSEMQISLEVGSDKTLTKRHADTAILYLITPESFSALHRLKYDEIVALALNILAGEKPQVIVPSGVWQGTRLKGKQGWALLGTTMAVSFEFSDFELGARKTLINHYPAISELIIKYTK